MSFLSPLSLLLGVAAAAVVVALHLLTTRRPPPLVLPTARFVPMGEARAVARASRPTDVLLMLLRMLAVLLVGAAFARPVIDAAGPSVRTVVLLERSPAVADTARAGLLAHEQAGEGGAVVEFDGSHDGSLSAAFIAARAPAARIAPGADSVRLVIVSPLLESAVDAATPALRAAWPGRVELVRVAATLDTTRGRAADLRTPLDDDPLAPAVARLGGVRGGDGVRIQRDEPASADLEWVRAGDRVLLLWPARFEPPVRATAVTAFGDRSATVVAPLARLPLGTARGPAASGADTALQVVARWNDAEPAAVQSPLGAGCVREVGIGIPLAGDITLRAPFDALLDVLTQPCSGRAGTPLPDSTLSWLTGPGGASLAPAQLVAAADSTRTSRLPAVLLGVALAMLVAEQLLRRREAA